MKPVPEIFIPVILVYFVLLVFIGWYSYRKTDSMKEFLTMGGTAGAIVGGFAYLSTQYSMSTFMGVPGWTWAYGYGIVGMTGTVMFSIWVPAFFVGFRLNRLGKKLNIFSLGDYFGDRYESNFARILVALITIVFLLPTMGAQTIGAGAIWNVFTGQPEWVGVALMAAIVTMYCLTGGIRGAILTDFVQAIMMLFTTLIFLFALVLTEPGLTGANAAIAKNKIDFMSFPGTKGIMTYGWLFSQLFLWNFFTIGHPQLVTKFLAIKNTKTILRAAIIGGFGMCFAAIFMEALGGTSTPYFPAGIEPKRLDFVVPTILSTILPIHIASLCMAGIVAAGMSTIDSQLVMVAGAVSRDIYQKGMSHEEAEKKSLHLARYATLVFGFCTFLIGVFKPATIFGLILFTWGGLGMITIPLLMGLRWKRATKQGAIASLIAGTVYHALAAKWSAFAFGFHPGVPALVVTLIVIIVVSLLTPPPSEAVLKRHYQKI
jgi:sodium/pantothenate symporter